jgi:hypothetical protein
MRAWRALRRGDELVICPVSVSVRSRPDLLGRRAEVLNSCSAQVAQGRRFPGTVGSGRPDAADSGGWAL